MRKKGNIRSKITLNEYEKMTGENQILPTYYADSCVVLANLPERVFNTLCILPCHVINSLGYWINIQQSLRVKDTRRGLFQS